jgi:hypothetical protein
LADTGGPYFLNAPLPLAVLADGRLSRFERACFIVFRGAAPGGRMSTSTIARFQESSPLSCKPGLRRQAQQRPILFPRDRPV